LRVASYAENLEIWDNFALQSDDGWFWHTTQYMEYAEQCAGGNFVANPSFALVDERGALAICPVMINLGPRADGVKQFSLGGTASLPTPIPFPAMRNGLSEDTRQRVYASYVQNLENIAAEYEVGYVSVRIPCVARSFLEPGIPTANPLLRYGFMDLGYISLVVDLSKDLKALWADVRKGHKADVKRAQQNCEIVVWDQSNLTTEKLRQYQLLHAKDRGGETRDERSFDLMSGWVSQGQAILVEAVYEDRAIGFSLVILFGSGAYYASTCKDPDHSEIAASHLIQWETICWLKDHGISWYDLGPHRFHPQWFEPPDARAISVARFKRGFGGRFVPLITVEYFYSRSLLKRTFENRLQGYLAALSPARVGR